MCVGRSLINLISCQRKLVCKQISQLKVALGIVNWGLRATEAVLKPQTLLLRLNIAKKIFL
jgi:hypothetical protein